MKKAKKAAEKAGDYFDEQEWYQNNLQTVLEVLEGFLFFSAVLGIVLDGGRKLDCIDGLEHLHSQSFSCYVLLLGFAGFIVWTGQKGQKIRFVNLAGSRRVIGFGVFMLCRQL